ADDPCPCGTGMKAVLPFVTPCTGMARGAACNAASADAAPYPARSGLGKPLAYSTSGSAGVRATWKALPRRLRAAPIFRWGSMSRSFLAYGQAHRANLEEPAERVLHTPDIRQPSILDAHEVHPGDGDAFARWRDAGYDTQVRALQDEMERHHVAFGNHAL